MKQLILLVAVLMMVMAVYISAYASGSLSIGEGRHGSYTEVSVGPERYYYHEGVYYTGGPGRYVAVDAPVGVVVYGLPAGYEEVEVDGGVYYRYHDVYYRHGPRGYEVVHIDRSHVHAREWARAHAHERDHRHDRH